MRYNNGFPVKIMSWAHLNGSGVVVGKHIKATNFKDLGGLQNRGSVLVLHAQYCAADGVEACRVKTSD